MKNPIVIFDDRIFFNAKFNVYINAINEQKQQNAQTYNGIPKWQHIHFSNGRQSFGVSMAEPLQGRGAEPPQS